MSARRFDLVLIDVDGTLVDTAPDIASGVNATLAEMGRETFPEEQIREWIGRGSERLLQAAFGGAFGAVIEPTLMAAAFDGFRRHYGNCVCDRSQLFPGVRETLDTLKSRGYALGVVTNKPEQFNTPLFDGLDVTDDFEVVVCGDTLSERKPHPLPLQHAAREVDMPLERTVMIGDSSNDIDAARAAGCVSICVTYGYNHGEDITRAGADHLVEQFSDILDLV